MIRPEVIRDTIAALVALNHKPAEAKRLVDTAIQRGTQATTVQELLTAVYAKPNGNTKQTGQAAQSRNALAYYAYYSGATASGDDAELVQIARAVGPGLTPEEFDALAVQVNSVKSNRRALTNNQFQESLWAIPDAFAAQRSNPVHFQPLRDPAGNPVDASIEPIPSSSIDGITPSTGGQSVNIANIIQQAVSGSATSEPSHGSTPSAITAMLNAEPTNPPPSTTSTLDNIQAAADAIGVVDQTGITDLANAGVSLTRAFTEPEQAGHHLFNAGISAVSAIPIVGDAAKLLKFGGKGSKAAQAAKAADGSWSMAGHHSIPNSVGRGAGGGNGPSTLGRPQGHHTIPSGSSGNPIDLGQYATGGAGETAQQAAKDMQTFTGAIESFMEKVVPGGAALVAIGSEVYNRALKPIIDWIKQVDETSKKMLEDNRRLSNFNGQVAAAYQQLDVGRFLRDQENAGEMAGSIGRLSGAQNRYENAQQDLMQPYNRLSADLQTGRTEIATMFLKLINSVDFIGGLLDWWYQKDKNDPGDRNDAERGARMLREKFAEKKVGPDKK